MRTRAIAIALVLLTATLVGARQEPLQRFRSGVSAVRVDVLVLDGSTAVRNLTSRDFDITDNGTAQRIERVLTDELPVSVVLALDTSGSVSGAPLESLRRAASGVLKALKAGDSATVLEFSDTLRRHAFVPGGDAEGAFQSIEAGGLTAFHDAAFTAMSLAYDDTRRGLVILCSDGQDTASWLRAADVERAARRNTVVVYTVGSEAPAVLRRTLSVPMPMPNASNWKTFSMGDRAIEPFDWHLPLRRLPETTGGRLLVAKASDALDATFLEILAEFRQRYVLTYYPTSTAPGWHAIDVKVKRRNVVVRARPGYEIADR